MKERPILFNGPMVRALLDGSKTQTRRVVKGQGPEWATFTDEEDVSGREFFMVCGEKESSGLRPIIDSVYCPYGQPGDRLWVRETWRGVVEISPPGRPIEHGVARYVPDREHCRRVEYAATQERDAEPWRPSIHMPRWASRILLEITGVRVERLQDISESDARAEGVTIEGRHKGGYCAGEFLPPSIRAYRDLWESINGADGWDANPWVWVVEFRRVAT